MANKKTALSTVARFKKDGRRMRPCYGLAHSNIKNIKEISIVELCRRIKYLLSDKYIESVSDIMTESTARKVAHIQIRTLCDITIVFGINSRDIENHCHAWLIQVMEYCL